MVFVKDSTKWVHDNCSISAPAKKRERKGDTSSPINSFPPSPASSTKKRSYDTAMSPPEEQVDHMSMREYRPLPKQAKVKPPAKRQRHVTFASLPDNMFHVKLRWASHPISFFDPLKNQKTPASSSRSVSQPSTSSLTQARVSGKHTGPGKHQKTPASSSRSVSQPSTSSSTQAHVSGKRAGPGKHSGGLLAN